MVVGYLYPIIILIRHLEGLFIGGADNTNDSCIVTPSENGYIRVSAFKAPNANTTITIKECILNPKTLTLGFNIIS